MKSFIIPYVLSQVFSLVILLASFRFAGLARILFSLLFGIAAGVNFYLVNTDPSVYEGFSPYALSFYANFITGDFTKYSKLVVNAIAFGQLLIAIGMLMKGRLMIAACIGAMLFLVAILPLGLGAAFPFPVTVAIAAYYVSRSRSDVYPWQNADKHHKSF